MPKTDSVLNHRVILHMILVAILAASFSCTSKPPKLRLRGPFPPPSAKAYPAILHECSRSAKIYKGLDNQLFVTSTFHTPQFRRAFAASFPDVYGHGGAITRRELVELTGDVERYHTFFLSVYTPNLKWNDIGQSDSIWRMTLMNDEGVSVGMVEALPVKKDANLKVVYPYIGRFEETYLVRFPLSDPMNRLIIGQKTKSLTLRMASALGAAELVWEFQPPVQP
ncbi:hypothetical protein KAI87_15025 [Myxococcota bacterium]|nr:hypothetical protein [Myxococcota bacterium]